MAINRLVDTTPKGYYDESLNASSYFAAGRTKSKMSELAFLVHTRTYYLDADHTELNIFQLALYFY